MNHFMFYKEFQDGTYMVVDNLSKVKAKRLYTEALKDWADLELKGCGWEEVQSPLTISQQVKFKKTGLI